LANGNVPKPGWHGVSHANFHLLKNSCQGDKVYGKRPDNLSGTVLSGITLASQNSIGLFWVLNYAAINHISIPPLIVIIGVPPVT